MSTYKIAGASLIKPNLVRFELWNVTTDTTIPEELSLTLDVRGKTIQEIKTSLEELLYEVLNNSAPDVFIKMNDLFALELEPKQNEIKRIENVGELAYGKRE